MNQIRVALVGAGGGFGRTVLLALRHHRSQRPTILCDLDPAAVLTLLADLDYPGTAQVCTSESEVSDVVGRGAIAVVSDAAFLVPSAYDVLVEATGSVPASARAALAAFEAERPVVMVSKETETAVGPALRRRAAEHGVVMRAGAGDQPANLAALVRWARELGMEVVAAGKSSEYDLVLDHDTGTVTQLETTVPAPDLSEHWLAQDLPATVAARAEATAGLKLRAAADYCEMTVAANLTGLGIDHPSMHYPILRVPELADAWRPRAEGGLLESTGVVDVFVSLRRPDEASFAGGEFVVVRVRDREVARLLAAKGHVVSRHEDLVCIGLPFHLMGLEIPRTIAQAFAGEPEPVAAHPEVAMLARTSTSLPQGHVFEVTGHHHEIAGTDPWLTTTDSGLPYYALDGARLRRGTAAGQLVQPDDVDGVDPLVLELLTDTP